MRVLFLLAIALTTFLGWRHWREASRENDLGAIASELAGRPVRVSCQGFLGRLVDVTPEAGVVYFGPDGHPASKTQLKSWVCDRLAGYRSTRRSPAFACVYASTLCLSSVEQTITALLVLAHESQHLRGVRSESQAQCFGLQTMGLVAERLGSPHAEAQAVAAHFLRVQQPYQASDYALDGECRDGGALDLVPDSPGWPVP